MASPGLGFRTACDVLLVFRSRKIKDSEFSMKFDGESVARARACDGIVKQSNPYPDSTMLHPGEPFLLAGGNSAKARRIIFGEKSTVGILLGFSGWPEVRVAVVQSISVGMVYARRWFRTKHYMVHDRSFALASSHVPTTDGIVKAVSVRQGGPRKAHQKIVSGRIDDCVEASGEGYFSARLTLNPKGILKDRRLVCPDITAQAERGAVAFLFAALRAGRVGPWLGFNSCIGTITSWLCNLLIQVKHSIPRYCVRRGAALNYPHYIRGTHG